MYGQQRHNIIICTYVQIKTLGTDSNQKLKIWINEFIK